MFGSNRAEYVRIQDKVMKTPGQRSENSIKRSSIIAQEAPVSGDIPRRSAAGSNSYRNKGRQKWHAQSSKRAVVQISSEVENGQKSFGCNVKAGCNPYEDKPTKGRPTSKDKFLGNLNSAEAI